jgi:hypothetical protein
MERWLTRRRAVRPQLKRDTLGRLEPSQCSSDVFWWLPGRKDGSAGGAGRCPPPHQSAPPHDHPGGRQGIVVAREDLTLGFASRAAFVIVGPATERQRAA